nr:uncharacterized protein LOC111512953 [Leptinotarsa decemlineata]
MKSSLSSPGANLFLEMFEEKALQSALFRLRVWRRYMNDTFVRWLLGYETLNVFVSELNLLHPKIQFTIEIEKNNQLPFLDDLLFKKPNRLGHAVNRRPTHAHRYLNSNSNYYQGRRCLFSNLSLIKLNDFVNHCTSELKDNIRFSFYKPTVTQK